MQRGFAGPGVETFVNGLRADAEQIVEVGHALALGVVVGVEGAGGAQVQFPVVGAAQASGDAAAVDAQHGASVNDDGQHGAPGAAVVGAGVVGHMAGAGGQAHFPNGQAGGCGVGGAGGWRFGRGGCGGCDGWGRRCGPAVEAGDADEAGHGAGQEGVFFHG